MLKKRSANVCLSKRLQQELANHPCKLHRFPQLTDAYHYYSNKLNIKVFSRTSREDNRER